MAGWQCKASAVTVQPLSVTVFSAARVAAISANDDEYVGAVIGNALHTVGDGGIVTVEESAMNGMSVDFVEGFELDNGYLSPYMVTNPASLEAIVDDPYILLCSEKITKVQQLMPILDKVMRAPRPLAIIAVIVPIPRGAMIRPAVSTG